MRLYDLPDDQLRVAASGEAAEILHQRQRQRQQQSQQRAEEREMHQAKQAMRSLASDDLEEIAADPRHRNHPEKVWQQVPGAVWQAGLEKDEVVDLAARTIEQRERAEQERRMQLHQPTARSKVDVAGVELTTRQLMLLAGAAGAVLLLSSGSSSSRSSAPVVTESGDIECPECSEEYSKNGLQGHLRWKHDWDSDRAAEAVREAADANP
jgi:hypothetical protein